ncbi:MAG TPA: hypothetical protein VKF62_00925 [Planctomycetota bacterium]|nr:hypothetical protein [Planctomycetota bacterium]
MPEKKYPPQLESTPTRIDFNAIGEPGTYVFEDTGTLVRVGPEALLQGHSPMLTMVNKQGVPCVRIWPDDTIPIEKARHVAANLGLPVAF